MSNGAQDNAFTRRAFLHHGVTLASASITVPWFVQGSASALAQALGGATSVAGIPDDRVLVIVQLGGGNDGLNTVVPFGIPGYYQARPGIAVPEGQVLRLNQTLDVGLHPRLAGLKSLYDEGLLSVIQGAGYPNPNRSHFKSMDIWHTAETSGTGDGWIGRYFDCECGGEPLPQGGIAIGREAPLAMQGRINKPVSFESPSLFQWTGAGIDEDIDETYERLTRSGAPVGADPKSNAAFLMRTALDAQIASDTIRRAVDAPSAAVYPRSSLAGQLRMVGAMIRAGLKTRVYYVSMTGFDTHAGQGGPQGRHATLLDQFGSALKAFYDDLKAQENDGRVLTMVFSEFGRRVSQNASQGTDHGTAAPMFLAGPMVRPGVLGDHPSLTDLDEGDLKFTVDFRCVYAAVLEDWLKIKPRKVLGRDFRVAKVIRG